MTWFKNVALYRLPAFALDGEALEAAFSKWETRPCGSYEMTTAGFARIRDERFVWSVEGEHFAAVRITRRVLPASVVKKEVERRAREIEKQMGFRPGKKQRKEIKEEVIEDLLPKSFEVSRDVRLWISPKRELLVIDTSSPTLADKIMEGLIRAIGTPFAIYQPRYNLAATRAMTQWIADEPPTGFTIDTDKTTFAAPEGNITFAGVDPSGEEVTRQIEAGRYVSTLALTFDDKISLVLTGANRITKLEALGITKPTKQEAQDPEAQNADLLLMAGTIGELIEAVAESLDGYQPVDDLFAAPDDDDEADDGEQTPAGKTVILRMGVGTEPPEGDGDEKDPLLAQAKTIVIAENRASVSLVQRHLRIGYNRAARLLELLEEAGVVSVMQSNGSRTVIGQGAA